MTKYEAMIAAIASYVQEQNAVDLAQIPAEEKAENPSSYDPATYGVTNETVVDYLEQSGLVNDVVKKLEAGQAPLLVMEIDRVTLTDIKNTIESYYEVKEVLDPIALLANFFETDLDFFDGYFDYIKEYCESSDGFSEQFDLGPSVILFKTEEEMDEDDVNESHEDSGPD